MLASLIEMQTNPLPLCQLIQTLAQQESSKLTLSSEEARTTGPSPAGKAAKRPKRAERGTPAHDAVMEQPSTAGSWLSDLPPEGSQLRALDTFAASVEHRVRGGAELEAGQEIPVAGDKFEAQWRLANLTPGGITIEP